ncbi:hypothetical protein SPI_00478 [Niveomyces insectorum RCEF 264]|uniref:Chitin-binding, domain 3 n=1 Tax=Niveomyces insectorum RCEF 264 TaxID=1081102 RepID=A0A168A5R7_9HYPO|nr:hypothetical protein SPI_00478 [Niveomyces insectorum RCEF 264]
MVAHAALVAIVALLSASTARAHMTLASPVPFGDPTTSPLDSSGANYPCQIVGSPATFYSSTAAAAGNNTMAVGEPQTLSFHGSAVHGGGSCQLALTTDAQPSPSTTWQVILSLEGGCPTTDGSGPSTYQYSIPDSIKPGKYVFAWTWISKLSGAPEYYMNCAPITVTAGSKKKRQPSLDGGDEPLTARDAAAALPNLFVANLASINSCKTTTGTDPLYPDPGPNVQKPSKMSTNFQAPAGTNCFPLGATGSSSSSSGSSSGSSSSGGCGSNCGSDSGNSTTTVGSSSGNSTDEGAGTGANGGGSGGGGGVFATATTPAAAAAPTPDNSTTPATGNTTDTDPMTMTTTAAAPPPPPPAEETTPAAQTTPAAPAQATTPAASSGTTSSGSSGAGLSGACTDEGTFNCVGGSSYQQCASGAWTALQPMPAGTTCQEGESATLWARDDDYDDDTTAVVAKMKRGRRFRRA